MIPLASQRWLLVAPHPDDEVFAAAITLQRLAAAGAAVRVLLATDGDNNPWPQRVAERRLVIDAAARRRWGARRRGEVKASLSTLGIDPEVALFGLGWPDGGIEARVLADPVGSIGAIAAVVDAFAPTHLLAPSAADRHPDHNTLAVLLQLACRGHPTLVRHAYRVHHDHAGPAPGVDATPAERERRERALACHRSQMLLSGKRLRRFAEDSDHFLDFDGEFVIQHPPTAADAPSRRHALLVASVSDDEITFTKFTISEVSAGHHQKTPRSHTGRIAPAIRHWKWVPERRGLWIYDARGWARGVP